MRNDTKSNYEVGEVIAAGSQAGQVFSAAVDHAKASSVSFFISAGTVGGTVDAISQYSEDDINWTDYPVDDEAKNDWAITQMTAAGSAQLNIPNPRGRYSRISVTPAGGAAIMSVVSVLGPLRHVSV